MRLMEVLLTTCGLWSDSGEIFPTGVAGRQLARSACEGARLKYGNGKNI